jgi:hypothetical protein
MDENSRRGENETYTLEIGTTDPIESGAVEMYASFDFISLTGIMRFMNPDARDQDYRSADFDGDEEDDEGEDQDEDEEDDDLVDKPKSSPFLISKALLPSSTTRKFKFRWRGEETGEGEIELYADQHVCSLAFESPNALSGNFVSSLMGNCKFRGVREGFETCAETKRDDHPPRKRPHRLDPGYEWESRSESAYEHARVARWH